MTIMDVEDPKMMATSIVPTPKASRYMKALCNHFDRKVTASYDGNQGQITFGFGSCQLQANEDSLRLQVEASGAENFARIQDVIGRHLERFSGDDTLQVKWDVNPPNN